MPDRELIDFVNGAIGRGFIFGRGQRYSNVLSSGAYAGTTLRPLNLSSPILWPEL